jgi:hypothetical protein
LIGAIPATVASTLITGAPPFAAPRARAAAAGQPADSQTEPPDPNADLKRAWGFAAGGLSLAASILTAFLDVQAVEVNVGGSTARQSTRVVGGAGYEWLDRQGQTRELIPWLDVRNRRGLGTSFEVITALVSLAATVAAHPGGYPTAPLEIQQDTWASSPHKHWEASTWVYDMCAFSLDVAFLILPGHSMARRGPWLGLVVATLRGHVDMGLVITTFVMDLRHGSAKDNATLPIKTAQAVTSVLPGMLPWLRYPPLVAASEGWAVAGLAASDLVFGTIAASLTFVMADQGML